MWIWTPARRAGVVMTVVGVVGALVCTGLMIFYPWGKKAPAEEVVAVTASPSATPTPTLSAEDREALTSLYWASIAAMEKSMKDGHRTLSDAQRASMTDRYATGYERALRRQVDEGLRPITGSNVRIGSIDPTTPGAAVVHSCEDSGPVRYVDAKGKVFRQKTAVRQFVSYEFVQVNGFWKLDGADSVEVDQFSGPHACV